MTTILRAAGALLPAIPMLVAGCAMFGYARVQPPQGTRALGLEFGSAPAEVRRTLEARGIGVRVASSDPDAYLADRCPDAPARAPCRLFFGPEGLYAAQVEVPAADAHELAEAVERGLGRPDRRGEPLGAEGAPLLIAGWDRPGWTVAVTRGGGVDPSHALYRVEYDRLAPPVVAGVPLGRLREDVEHALEIQGATLVQRDEETSTYLGCPQGASDALSCIVLFRGGRAAAVTEIHPASPSDQAALSAWRILAKRFEKEIGRAPDTACPSAGPDRVGGDCTATWTSDRLVVVVGAHRNAGASHRGAISVYTAFTYPALGAGGGEAEAGARADAR